MEDTQQRVFDIVKLKVAEVLIDVDPVRITREASLVDLGANSIDRVEVAMSSMEELGLDIPGSALHGVKNIGELVDALSRHLEGE